MPLKGFGDLTKKLNQIKKNAKKLDGEHHLTFDELFNVGFMEKHTSHKTIGDFVEASKVNPETVDDFEDNAELDAFVAGNSKFASWSEMRDAAVGEYANKQLMAGL